MRSKKQTFVYEHPFEVLVEAYNRRFPTSPRIPILLSSTVVAEDDLAGVGRVQVEHAHLPLGKVGPDLLEEGEVVLPRRVLEPPVRKQGG